MDVRTCTRCERQKPASAFGVDKRRPDGLRSECRICLRELQRARRRGKGPAAPVVGLVLVPTFPAAPDPPEDSGGPPLVGTVLVGGDGDTFAAAVERALAALKPAPGDVDAALVKTLRVLAEMLDRAEGGGDQLREVAALVPKFVTLMRELRMTRATAVAEVEAPEAEDKLDAFLRLFGVGGA